MEHVLVRCEAPLMLRFAMREALGGDADSELETFLPDNLKRHIWATPMGPQSGSLSGHKGKTVRADYQERKPSRDAG